MTTATMKKSEVGELRPSQLLLTFGVGAIVDLPNMSVMVMGLDDWPIRHSPRRLGKNGYCGACRTRLGPSGEKAADAATGPRNRSRADKLVR